MEEAYSYMRNASEQKAEVSVVNFESGKRQELCPRSLSFAALTIFNQRWLGPECSPTGEQLRLVLERLKI
jgi:hypothetical protein